MNNWRPITKHYKYLAKPRFFPFGSKPRWDSSSTNQDLWACSFKKNFSNFCPATRIHILTHKASEKFCVSSGLSSRTKCIFLFPYYQFLSKCYDGWSCFEPIHLSKNSDSLVGLFFMHTWFDYEYSLTKNQTNFLVKLWNNVATKPPMSHYLPCQVFGKRIFWCVLGFYHIMMAI